MSDLMLQMYSVETRMQESVARDAVNATLEDQLLVMRLASEMDAKTMEEQEEAEEEGEDEGDDDDEDVQEEDDDDSDY